MDQLRGEIFRKIYHKNVNAYVKVGDEYIGIIYELFQFEFIKKNIEYYESKTFQSNEYNNLPILLTLEEKYKASFSKLHNFLISGEPPNLLPGEELLFISILVQIGNDLEIFEIVKDLQFTKETYINLPTVAFSANFIKESERWYICQMILDEYRDYEEMCKYGTKCPAIYDERVECPYGHGGILTKEQYKEVDIIFRFYGLDFSQLNDSYRPKSEIILNEFF
jgi:hypothetical protein